MYLFQNIKAAKTTLLMVGALMVCYLPLVIKWKLCWVNSPVFSIMAQVWIRNIYYSVLFLFFFFKVCVAVNSFVNPFIYAFHIPAFRTFVMSSTTEKTSKQLQKQMSSRSLGSQRSSQINS